MTLTSTPKRPIEDIDLQETQTDVNKVPKSPCTSPRSKTRPRDDAEYRADRGSCQPIGSRPAEIEVGATKVRPSGCSGDWFRCLVGARWARSDGCGSALGEQKAHLWLIYTQFGVTYVSE